MIIPSIDNKLNSLLTVLNETEAAIDFMTSNLNVTGSNANIIANSVFTTSDLTGMYNYLKNSSNQLQIVEVPSSS